MTGSDVLRIAALRATAKHYRHAAALIEQAAASLEQNA